MSDQGPCVTFEEISDQKIWENISSKWHDIGTALKVNEHQLRIIEKDEDGDLRRLKATLSRWHSIEKLPTWQKIIDALRSKTVGEGNFAEELARSKGLDVGRAAGGSFTAGNATTPSNAKSGLLKRNRTLSAAADVPEELFSMSWKTSDSSAPEKILRPIGAIVHDNKAYFRNFRTRTVYSFDNKTQNWKKLPDCPIEDTSLVVLPVTDKKGVIHFRLHTVGGRNSKDHHEKNPTEEFTSVLFQLQSLEAGSHSWWNCADYPDMKFKRSQVMVVYNEGYIIVAGGCGSRGAVNKVEVLNTKQRHMDWYEVASLPQPVYKASRCVCNGFLYILGGHVLDHSSGGFNATKCAYKAPIRALVDSRSDEDDVFDPINDLPLKESAFVSVRNHIVEVGGWKFDPKANQPMGTKLVHVLNNDDSWVKLDERMNEPRCQGFAVAFDDKIMAVGGHNKPNGLATNSVEFASLNIDS